MRFGLLKPASRGFEDGQAAVIASSAASMPGSLWGVQARSDLWTNWTESPVRFLGSRRECNFLLRRYPAWQRSILNGDHDLSSAATGRTPAASRQDLSDPLQAEPPCRDPGSGSAHRQPSRASPVAHGLHPAARLVIADNGISSSSLQRCSAPLSCLGQGHSVGAGSRTVAFSGGSSCLRRSETRIQNGVGCLSQNAEKEGLHHGFDFNGHLFSGYAIGCLEPAACGSKDCPGGRR